MLPVRGDWDLPVGPFTSQVDTDAGHNGRGVLQAEGGQVQADVTSRERETESHELPSLNLSTHNRPTGETLRERWTWWGSPCRSSPSATLRLQASPSHSARLLLPSPLRSGHLWQLEAPQRGTLPARSRPPPREQLGYLPAPTSAAGSAQPEVKKKKKKVLVQLLGRQRHWQRASVPLREPTGRARKLLGSALIPLSLRGERLHICVRGVYQKHPTP